MQITDMSVVFIVAVPILHSIKIPAQNAFLLCEMYAA